MSAFTNGVQNAAQVFDLFAEGIVTLGTVAMTTSETAKEVAHGLSSTPDWALVSTSGNPEGVSYELGATTLTVNKTDTNVEASISYLIGNLS